MPAGAGPHGDMAQRCEQLRDRDALQTVWGHQFNIYRVWMSATEKDYMASLKQWVTAVRVEPVRKELVR